MKLKVDLSNKPKELTTLEFLLLAFHDHLTREDFNISDETIVGMQTLGYVKITDSESGLYDLRAKSLKFKAVDIDTVVEEVKVSTKSTKTTKVVKVDWIDEYRKLFKAKSTATGVMGARTQCIAKMQKFIKETGASKADILAATKLYLDTLQDVRFLQQADYFISKNGGSRLEAFIEEYKEKGSTDTFYEAI